MALGVFFVSGHVCFDVHLQMFEDKSREKLGHCIVELTAWSLPEVCGILLRHGVWEVGYSVECVCGFIQISTSMAIFHHKLLPRESRVLANGWPHPSPMRIFVHLFIRSVIWKVTKRHKIPYDTKHHI